MTLTSVGYPRTDGNLSVTAVQWAQLASDLGSVYGVRSPADLALSSISGGVSVAAGVAFGRGITDTLDATQSVTIETPSSGSTYWLVVLRRSWQAVNTSTLMAVPLGISLPATIPGSPTRKSSPGIEDDQPLGIVQMTAGSTAGVIVRDLRLVGAGPSQVAFSSMALDLVKRPGQQLRIGQDRYLCEVVSGAVSWRKDSDLSERFVYTFPAQTIVKEALAVFATPDGGGTTKTQYLTRSYVRTPHVVLTNPDGQGGSGFLTPKAWDVTATSFKLALWNLAPTSQQILWPTTVVATVIP